MCFSLGFTLTPWHGFSWCSTWLARIEYIGSSYKCDSGVDTKSCRQFKIISLTKFKESFRLITKISHLC